MARQHHKRWWPAGLWLPLLLTTAAGPAWAVGGIDTDMTVASRIPGVTDTGAKVTDFFRRLAAPLAAPLAAVADEPNIMAANTDEQTQQMLQSIARREDVRRERENVAPAVAARKPQPLQTPPPSLKSRQNADDGQIQALSAQIQSISLVASSISQASRQVSQTSQQLAQSVTQLSQSTDRLSQSINSLQNSAQQAQQSAQSAQDAARQASQSASQAISSAISSAQSSASAVVASNIASITSSASAIIAAASASAAQLARVAASQVQSAQADATIARADAATQVQQAQGTAVSVTQAALAIVGAFVGSSLLTILAFYLVLRYKTNRKRRRTRLIATRGDNGYPKQGDDDDTDNRGTYGYPIDLKDPPRKSMTGGGGDSDGFNEKRPEAAHLRGTSAVAPTNKNGGGDLGAGFGFGGAFGSGSGSSISMVGPLPASNNNGAFGPRKGSVNNGRSSFSLFPKTPTSDRDNETMPSTQAQQVVSPSIYATGTSAMTNTLSRANTTTNNPTRAPPSLQQWLREGTVSPFGTLKRTSVTDNTVAAATSPDRKQQQLRNMMKRSVGVGGVNAGGGGSRVMQPGRSLPLRDN
ncbi:hypothetical protein Sste5346_008394 [Sporothrix stenoceras]|uniref:Uncharacterized protein n=1 Tax=Sporothrix stenoceras TaxID=5173 RepID=A0ABR3YQI4_9PEZI